MSGGKISDELLYAWVDGEAGPRAADVRDLVENDPTVAVKAEAIRKLGRDINAIVDSGLDGAVDPLFALSKIRQRIAERKARTVSARLSSWWGDVLLFHRRALAGVAVAAALGALSAPGVVWLARDRVAPAPATPSTIATSVTVESLEVGKDGKATVIQNDDGNTTLIWVEPAATAQPREY